MVLLEWKMLRETRAGGVDTLEAFLEPSDDDDVCGKWESNRQPVMVRPGFQGCCVSYKRSNTN
jgi:hypothetical protein